MAAHGAEALIVHKKNTEVAIGRYRLCDDTAIHIGMPARFPHQSRAQMVEVLPGVAPLGQDGVPRQFWKSASSTRAAALRPYALQSSLFAATLWRLPLLFIRFTHFKVRIAIHSHDQSGRSLLQILQQIAGLREASLATAPINQLQSSTRQQEIVLPEWLCQPRAAQSCHYSSGRSSCPSAPK